MQSGWLNIAELMVVPRPSDMTVSWDGANLFTWKDFQSDIARLSGALLDAQPRRVAICTDSAYWFAVGLLAVFQAQLPLVLLPNAQSASLSLLDESDVLLSDRAIIGGQYCQLDLRTCTSMSDFSSASFRALDASKCHIEIYTSGSTGQPKRVVKSLANFEAEILVLEQFWGQRLEHHRIVGSVSHQHVYGVLFRIMWPLCAGRAFAARMIEYPEQIVQQEEYPVALVSSPALLKRISDEPVLSRLDIIFSSGGPLEEAVNLEICKRWNVVIWEIFGSTETGGVAVRNRMLDEYWRLMPGVEATLSDDGSLWVESPHVASGMQAMADKAVLLPDSQLQLLGRSDRIVKLEEKRVSLTAVERRAVLMDCIIVVHAFVLHGKRELLALVVELSDAGKRSLLEHGAAELKKQIRIALGAEFEPVALPRKIRFVNTIPTNTQGKFDKEAIEKLFEGVSEPVRLPQVLASESGLDKVGLHIRVPPDCCWFDGHFDGAPILSGVAQLDWVMELAAVYLGVTKSFGGVEVLKFQQVIRPGDEVFVDLEYKSDKQRLHFVMRNSAQCSSGRIILVAKSSS